MWGVVGGGWALARMTLAPLPARLNDTLCSPFEWLTEDTLVAVIVANAGDALPLASTLPVPIIAGGGSHVLIIPCAPKIS